MLLDSRTMAGAALLVLVAGVTPKAFAAGAAVTPAAPTVPPTPSPTWAIAVPVQLSSIPPRYPRFSVVCSVWGRPTALLTQGYVVATGTQDWGLDSNGAYSGTVTVRVYLVNNMPASLGRGGTFICSLRLIDANNHSHFVGTNEDPSLQPQPNTTFVDQITGPVPS
jgi:hypothetical protein